MMRQYKKLLQGLLVGWVKQYRVSNDITQEAMAEKLRISPRSYSDLEREIFCFSAVTLMFFLLILSKDEAVRLLEDFRILVDREDQNIVA